MFLNKNIKFCIFINYKKNIIYKKNKNNLVKFIFELTIFL